MMSEAQWSALAMYLQIMAKRPRRRSAPEIRANGDARHEYFFATALCILRDAMDLCAEIGARSTHGNHAVAGQVWRLLDTISTCPWTKSRSDEGVTPCVVCPRNTRRQLRTLAHIISQL